MAKNKRTAFFISDGTGITAGSLGGLLAHFPETEFDQIRIPFTDSIEKVEDAQKRVANAKMMTGSSQCKNDDWVKTYRYYVNW